MRARTPLLLAMLAALAAPASAAAGAKSLSMVRPLWVNKRDTLHVAKPGSQVLTMSSSGHSCQFDPPIARTLPFTCNNNLGGSTVAAVASYRVFVGTAKRIYATASFDSGNGSSLALTWVRNGRYIVVKVPVRRTTSGDIDAVHVALRWSDGSAG
jgi:hypothetical protein